MNAHINIRCTLYPLPRMRNGYFSSNKCCGCTATETVERTGCKPDDGTGEQGLNKNQEAQKELDNRKLCGTYSDREPALGGAAPAKKGGSKVSKYYVGVKIVFAWEQEKDGKPGYAVKYPDGYTSWSPKDVFEAAYLPMGDINDNTVTQEMVDLFTGKEYYAEDLPDGKTTLTSCKTASGFMQYEVSSCVDPNNYDSIIGSEIGLKRIKDRLWSFLGFVVQWGKYGIDTKIGLNK
jgi:hypothetical protein